MGVKEVDRKQRSVPTSDQIRLAKLTANDGGAVDDDQELIKRLIKKVIEATLCSKSQAEIALLDNGNDVDAAVLQIVENSSNLNWTEQKNRKDKKKEDEIVKPVRGHSSTRGRSGQTREWSDRANGNRGKSNHGGGNESSTTTRGSDSRGAARGENGRGGGRGNNAGRQQRENRDTKVAPTENGGHENHDWKNGPLVFKRTEENTTTATESTTSVPSIPLTNGSTSTGPISFAAVAAAGVNKERHRQQQQQQQQKLIAHVEESKPSASVEEVTRVPPPVEVEAESSLNTCVPLEEEPLDINQPTSTTTDWANKLKADLGIGVPAVESFGPPEVANPVEFMSDAATSFSGLQEYQFGFNSEPVESILPPSPANQPAPAVQMPEAPLFTRSPIVPSSSSQTIPPKAETLPSQNGEFSNLKSSPPNVPVSSYAQQMQQQQQPRTLSYDTSSVSYAPPDGRAPLSKPPTTQPVHVQNPPPPTHQMPYAAPQMQYPNYPYLQNVNMYSPALRNDDANFAATALLQYPFAMGGQIDLSQLLPQGALSAGQSQQVPQPQHRNDNPQMMDLNKFPSGVNSGRDSAVGPPPGFANPSAAYMAPHAQQNLQNLFMQQQYGPSGPFPYIMQPTVNQARQMYGGAADEERKNFERNAGKQGGAQQTPPPHYQQHNGYMQGLGKPKPQQYGHTNSGWN